MGYVRILTIQQQSLREKMKLILGRPSRTAIGGCLQQVELPLALGKVLGKKHYVQLVVKKQGIVKMCVVRCDRDWICNNIRR